MRAQRRSVWKIGLVALAMLGCNEPPAPAACLLSRIGDTVQVSTVDEVDLLFVIDDSSSMADAQLAIVEQIPRMIEVLASGDRDGDGIGDVTPARSIHVGVVSSNLGAGTASVESCDGVGDDGIMSNRGCTPMSPSGIFEFIEGEDRAAFASDVACAASLGTGGCAHEQQLDAALKALSLVPQADGSSPVTWTRPGYRPPVFAGSTFGHGGEGAANDGFLRPDSALAILLVTDDEDCSVSDPGIFDASDPRFESVPVGLRCHTFTDAQHPIQRYIDGLIGLRSQASLLIFAAIIGVPQDAIDAGLGYDAILGLEQMTERVDPLMPDQLLASCTTPTGAIAFPPRRIVQVAQGLERLGASTTVQSICNTDFTGAVDVVLEKISAALAGACIPRRSWDPPLSPNCGLFLLLPEIGGTAEVQHCSDMPSPEAFTLAQVEVTTVGGVQMRRELCGVRHVARDQVGTLPGWFYDDGDPRLGTASHLPDGCSLRIAFSVVHPPSFSEFRLECFETIYPGTGAAAELGAFCDPETGIVGGDPTVSCSSGIATIGSTSSLACDAFDETCQLPCVSDADCSASGLRAWVCDQRTPDERFEGDLPDRLIPIRDQPHGFCVNPTCEALIAGFLP